MIRIGTCQALLGTHPSAVDLVIDSGSRIPERLGPSAKLILGADPGHRAERVLAADGRATAIADALLAGAEIVVAPGADAAACVVAAGMWHYGWTRGDLDQLAGATIAGVVLADGRFPLVELFKDGWSLVTGAPATAEAIAEILARLKPKHRTPDVRVQMRSVRLHQEAHDRVRVYRSRGRAA